MSETTTALKLSSHAEIARYVDDDFSYRTVLEGAKACALADRAFRTAVGYEIRKL